jgi:peptide/nickel transport system permease protein
MTTYLIRRLLQAVVVTWLVTLLVFVLLKLLPGGPVRAILGTRANDPALVRALHGNLGFSYQQNQPVSALLATALPKTLLLLGSSTLLALLIAIPLGVAQAVKRNKLTDYIGTGFSFLFYAMPDYLLGIILINIAAEPPRAWFPPEAAQAPGTGSFFTDFDAMVLPVLALTLLTVAAYSRYMRSATLDQITQDYVRTARAKGASERRILYRHIMRNALIPIATLIGLSLPVLFSGDLLIEDVYNYPGMGNLFIVAATNQDYPILLGVTALVAFATVVGSLLADVLYAVLDPRVRYVGIS